MTGTGVLRGLLERVGSRTIRKADVWSVVSIEKMLSELEITGYEFMYQSRVVKLAGREDLMRIMKYTVPSEVSSEYDLIGKLNDDLRLHLGSWQFGAKA